MTRDSLEIGLLGERDLEAALALSAAEGWNQLAEDWLRLFRLAPDGCFAARSGDRLVGTVTTIAYGRVTAWIGMMLVDRDYRRRGIGAALMRRVLQYLRELGVGTAKLDATPAGRPLYESLGFTAEAEIERWQGIARPRSTTGPESRTSESRELLFALDRVAFGADRSPLLDMLADDGIGEPLVVHSASGAPVACALALPTRTAIGIGPLIAASSGAAEAALDGTFARLAGREVSVDLHVGGCLQPGALAARGLTMRRGLTRMYHGPRIDAGTSPMIGAIAGPAFG